MDEYWLMYLLTRLPLIHEASAAWAVIFTLIAFGSRIAVLSSDGPEDQVAKIGKRLFKISMVLVVVCSLLLIASPSQMDLLAVGIGGLVLEGKDATVEKIEKLSTLLDINLDTLIDEAKARAIKAEE